MDMKKIQGSGGEACGGGRKISGRVMIAGLAAWAVKV